MWQIYTKRFPNYPGSLEGGKIILFGGPRTKAELGNKSLRDTREKP